MKRKHLFLLSVLWVILIGTVSGEEGNKSDYGLYIKAFPSNDQEKTSLVLENNQPVKLQKETSMSFDMYVRKENVFGVVFRILTNNKDNIDFVFTVGENDKRYPMLIINESVYLLSREIKCEEWMPVNITFSRSHNQLSIEYNGEKLTQSLSFSKINNMHVSFGICPFENYTLYDIASVNIRDIKITDKKKLRRFWKLEKHRNNLTLDSVASVPAGTVNAQWLTDIYSTWKTVFSEKIPDNSLFAYNREENVIYMVAPDSKTIRVIELETGSSETIETVDGIISANAPNQLFYDEARKELVTYNLNENITARFSFQSRSWNNRVKPTLDHRYTNNSVSFSESDSNFVSFGGYGFYKYNNEMIRLDKEGKIIKKSTLPDISPRYAASGVIVDNTLYLFGGRGNKSGRQELSPKNVYDFYAVNLITEQVNKLWEDESITEEFFPGENMVFDSIRNCFYVYATKEGGMLMKINRSGKVRLEQVSFPIGENLSSHYLYTNLYFSPEKKKFYALVNKINTDKSAELTIYSLNYPPVSVSVNENNESEEVKPESPFPFSTTLFIVFGLALSGMIIYYIIKKYKKEPIMSQDRVGNTEIRTEKEEIIPVIPEKGDTNYYDFTHSSICFLGGFLVSDKHGQNITGQFTPMLKLLLVLLILHTIKDPKGISGKKLIGLLWYDKSENSAKNNRNVYMSKLRSVLENIGKAEIINQNGYWAIHLHEIKCDYTETMELFSKLKETERISPDEVNRLMELLLRGVLLPNTEVDWTDGFKSDFSNLTIDVLSHLSRDESYMLSDELKLKIADTLFLHDFVNEEALYLKCSILYNSGKKGIAKTVYDNFRKEYKTLLGIEYKYSLQDVINRKNIE
jgi:DNA-binding transcriptional activator of the SARP family